MLNYFLENSVWETKKSCFWKVCLLFSVLQPKQLNQFWTNSVSGHFLFVFVQNLEVAAIKTRTQYSNFTKLSKTILRKFYQNVDTNKRYLAHIPKMPVRNLSFKKEKWTIYAVGKVWICQIGTKVCV